MKENLNTNHFANGELIPQARTIQEWKTAAENRQPAWCYFENSKSYGSKYGKLYNWYAVSDLRGVAPKGWHIPTDAEWDKLVKEVGGDLEAGTNLKSQFRWKNKGIGQDKFGFSALPGGAMYLEEFSPIEQLGVWWSSSDVDSTYALYRSLYFADDEMTRNIGNKFCGFSIRCIKD